MDDGVVRFLPFMSVSFFMTSPASSPNGGHGMMSFWSDRLVATGLLVYGYFLFMGTFWFEMSRVKAFLRRTLLSQGLTLQSAAGLQES
jgi:hypothetical protein